MKTIYLSYSIRNSAAARIVELLREQTPINTVFYNPFHQLEAGADWSDTLQQEIARSDALIAFSQVSSVNVHFELGCAFGVGKPVLIVADSDGSIPYPFRNARVLLASADTDTLIGDILEWVDQVAHQETVHAAFGTALQMLRALEVDPSQYAAIHSVEFERAVLDGLRHLGFDIVVPEQLGVADLGFDAIVKAPNGEEWAMEIRKLRPMSKSSISEVRRLVGSAAMRGIHRTILISPTGFTESTKAFVVEANMMIKLLDAKNLIDLLNGNQGILFR